jgi:hypothetical protein
MPFTVAPSDDGTHIVATVDGDMSREQATEVAAAVKAIASETGIRCYLIDVSGDRGVMKMSDGYRHARSDLRELGIDRRACVAILAAPGDDSHDRFATMASSAGLDLTLFHDRAEAIAHLEDAAKRLPPRFDF